MPLLATDLPLDTELVCAYCSKELASAYPCMIVADGKHSRTYHFCEDCFRGEARELESQYQLSLVAREAGRRESMEGDLHVGDPQGSEEKV